MMRKACVREGGEEGDAEGKREERKSWGVNTIGKGNKIEGDMNVRWITEERVKETRKGELKVSVDYTAKIEWKHEMHCTDKNK